MKEEQDEERDDEIKDEGKGRKKYMDDCDKEGEEREEDGCEKGNKVPRM